MSYHKFKIPDTLIHAALKEDIGSGDVTTNALINKKKSVTAVIIAQESCILCGIHLARDIFKEVNKKITFHSFYKDGQKLRKGEIIARVQGPARGILTAERVALNFLSLLSGISTQTRAYVNAVKPYQAKILDTRKTIPAIREIEKYAVRMGGGFNHRFSLDEMILVKDNHLKIVGGLHKLKPFSQRKSVEIEVGSLKEFKQALRLRPDIIMLDNMAIKDIKKAVIIRNNLSTKTSRTFPKLEASGTIGLSNIRRIAACGVEFISVGRLTHSVRSADISLEIV